MKNSITIETTIKAPLQKVWELWNSPGHIMKWNSASPEWHTPRAENDLRVNGKFVSRMEAKDGSMGFDFEGTYNEIKPLEKIAYTIADGRKVEINFRQDGSETRVVETFEPESQNPVEMQRGGWQNILDSFKHYVESN
jgi:uncharacterized protein YndB with AHSA1/START domain